MKKIFAFTVAALSLLAVSCNKEVAPESMKMVSKTFTVTAPDGTRTELSGTMDVVWSTDDEINVIAVNSGNQYTFTLTKGAGTATAKFSGQLKEEDAEETEFYALYPNVPIRLEEIDSNDNRYALDQGQLIINDPVTTQEAVKGSFPTAAAFMTASADADGNFAFHHGAAYFKLTIPEDDITTIHFEVDGKARLGGRPVYAVTDGTTFQVNGAKSFMDFTCESGFEKNAVYYVPVLTKQSTCGNLTITFTKASGASCNVTTKSLTDKKLQSGKIYDLGCPPADFTTKIVVEDMSIGPEKVSSTDCTPVVFRVVNPLPGYKVKGSRNAAAVWFSPHDIQYEDMGTSGTMTYYTADANTGTEPRSVQITLTYYNAANTSEVAATATFTLTQKAPGAATEEHEHVLYYNSSNELVNLSDGETGTYFTATGKTDLSSDYYQDFNPWTIGEYSSTKGVKLNSSGKVTFTTSGSLNSTVQFWFIRRKTGDDTAKIQLVPASGDAVVFDTPYDTIGDSGEIPLAKGTAYTIQQQSKEQALLLVIVKETE